MAYNLQTARQAAQQRGEKPPGGEQPGTPAYDEWVMRWFEAGLDAGDPDIVKRAGGGSGAGWGSGQAEEGEGGIAPWQDAAPSSEWLGKRAPTPRELRRYAHDAGWSEDFQRFDDRQLAKWLKDGGWDVQQGIFQGGVQKPTETGGLMAPGARAGGGGGGLGGGAGAGQLPVGAKPAAPTGFDWSQYLPMNPLAQMLANQGGQIRQYDQQIGDENPGVRGGVMQGGGIWYQPLNPNPSRVSTPAPTVMPGGNMTQPVGGAVRPAPGATLRGGSGVTAPGSPLTNVMAPLQTGVTGGQPFGGSSLGAAMAPAQTFGQQKPGLTGLMGGLQPARKRAGGWF